MIFQKGLVLRKSGEKTFKVLIQKRVLHKKYKKILTRFKKILIDDRFNCCRPGWEVLIKQKKPVSRFKHWVFFKKI